MLDRVLRLAGIAAEATDGAWVGCIDFGRRLS